MVKVTVLETVAVPLPALTLAANVPLVLGVPLINPVDVLIVMPGGRPVALKVVGELVAVIWYVSGNPAAPEAVGPLVITGAPRPMVMVSGAAGLVPEPLLAATWQVEVPSVV